MTRYGALAVLLTLAACSGGGGSADGNSADPVALVSLGAAKQGSVSQTTTLYGAVEKGAEAEYTLSAPVEAVVAAVPAPVGTAVKRGTLVVRLRPSPTTRADLAKAIGDARTADQALARAKRLRADGLASDADVESARAAAQGAEAVRAGLSTQTNALGLRAPGSGYVESIAANPGDIVTAGTTIATISRAGDLRARFGIDPEAARKLSQGSVLRIAPAGGGTPFSAPILSVDPSIDPQTRLASVFVRVPAGQGIGAGQPLTAQVPIAKAGDALTIPYAALLDDGGQPFVYIVSGGVAHRRDVVTGATSGKRIAITRGVSPGDKVVTQGGTAIEDGMKVRTK